MADFDITEELTILGLVLIAYISLQNTAVGHEISLAVASGLIGYLSRGKKK